VGNYINIYSELPESETSVRVITNRGRELVVYFELFLGNKIWEFDSLEDDEEVLGWEYLDK